MIKKTSGFTLIELMVAIIILGILVGLAIPTSRRILPGIRLRAAVQGLTSDLRLARQKALSENVSCLVRFRPDSTYYQVSSANWQKTVKLPSGITFVAPTALDTVRFQANGTANSAKTITLKNTWNAQYSVTVLLSGLVRL